MIFNSFYMGFIEVIIIIILILVSIAIFLFLVPKQVKEKWGCKHDWEEIKKIRVFDEFSDTIPSHYEYLFKCKKCGKLKKKKF